MAVQQIHQHQKKTVREPRAQFLNQTRSQDEEGKCGEEKTCIAAGNF